jgi:hypothetical protein
VLVVPRGAKVRIAWSADQPSTVHLEGYDLSVEVLPGRPAVMEFDAFATGRFAVHAHVGLREDKSSTHAHGRGALLRIEVHPK